MGSKSQMQFRTQIMINFRDADPAGVAFFAQVLQKAHDVYEAFVVELGFSWEFWFKSSEFKVPVKQAQCSFQGALNPGKIYEVIVDLKHIGQTSFSTCYEFKLAAQTVAQAEIVHVFTDQSGSQKMDIPPDIKARLLPFCRQPVLS